MAALTKSSSISLRSLRPASTPSFVISVNITREILDLSISLAIWAAIASPSLSESVAIITSGAVFDIFLSSLTSFFLSSITSSSIAKSFSISTDNLFSGNSFICPIVDFTSYAPFKYFDIVLALDGDSTINNGFTVLLF